MEVLDKLVVTEEIDFQKYWLVLKRRWFPAAAIFGSVVGLTACYLLLQRPVYEAKGKLLVKRPTNVTSAIKEDQNGQRIQDIGDLQSVGSLSDPLETETELIRSAPVMKGTIAALNLRDEQGDSLKPEDLFKRLSIKNLAKTDILEISYKDPAPEEAAQVVNEMMRLYLQRNVLVNREEAATAREFIAEQLPKTEATVRQAEGALRQFKQKNNVVALKEEASSAVGVIANLEDQVSQAQAELNDISAHSQDLRSKLGMSSQEAITASSLGQATGVQNALEELRRVESQLAVERTRYQEAHPLIVELKQEQAALRNQLQGQVQQVAGTQTQQSTGNLQTAALKQQLTADLVRTEANRLGLLNRVSTLSNVLATQKQRANNLPKLEQRQNELERSLEAAQSTYNTLLRRLEEIRVEENRNVANARIVEVAEVPSEPAAANKKLKLAAGGAVGALLGIAAAFLLDLLDPSVKTVKESKELFGYTLLGIIPAFGRTKKFLPPGAAKFLPAASQPEPFTSQLVVRDLPRSAISEQYRMIQANLKYLNSDQPPKVIVVTSSVPQEGKSTVSANLALAMARPGQRVLLVDADMRRPSQHHIWNLTNDVGLSEVLSKQVELPIALKAAMPNLEVLTAGAIPLNPVDLLDSHFTAELIQNLANHYDFVIIDTPGLNVAADASILGRVADGLLFVVRPGVVDYASASASQELLRQLGQTVLGQVVNGVIPENEPNGYAYGKEYYCEKDFPAQETAIAEIKRHRHNP